MSPAPTSKTVKAHKNIFSFVVPIFRSVCRIEINNPPQVNLKENEESVFGIDGFVGTTKFGDPYVWFDVKNIGTSTIAHESVHLAHKILKVIGIGEDDEELIAYLVTFCVEEINKIFKKHKIQIKD